MKSTRIAVDIPLPTYEVMIEAVAEELAKSWYTKPTNLAGISPEDRKTLRLRAKSYLDAAFSAVEEEDRGC